MFEKRRTLIALLSIVLVLSLVPSMYGASVPDPIVDLGFNEGSGTTAANSGTAGGELTLSVPRPMWSDNVPPGGGASSLDFGTEAGGYYAESLDVISELGGLEKFTVTLWVNCTDSTEGSGGNRLVCWKVGQNGDGLDFVYLSNGGLHMAVNEWPDYPNNRPTRSSEGVIPTDAAAGADNWRFIALTYDSTLASDHVTYYFGTPGEPAAKDVSCTYPEGGAVGTNIQLLTIGNFTGSDRGMTGRQFRGLMDEVKIFGDALTLEQIQSVQTGTKGGLASSPDPADEATDVPRDRVLSWAPGESAQTHDVYFGEVFDDVNDATRTDPRGVLVSQDQNATTYDPVGPLQFDQTYYWRIDEVNGAPDYAVLKGAVWSFTVEPVAYAVEDVIATSNTTSSENQGPERAVDGSGLNADDQHSTTVADMWAGEPGDEPPYIQFEFDRVYKLHEMLVWNYNMDFEFFLGLGVKEATIEYSEDGTAWMTLGDFVLNQGPGSSTYTYSTIVPFEGAAAKSVRVNIHSSWNPAAELHGLSEVRFMYIPVHAREPQPAEGATSVAIDSMLSWRAGRGAVSHEVYLGIDPNALSLDGMTTVNTYDPGILDLDTTIYWQIVEVNNAETVPAWAGDVWSFSTQEYIEIEGFESYDDDVEAGTTIWQSWIDGLDDPTNGDSQVGHNQSPFAELDIVHGGGQSMPLSFNNGSASAFSETDRTFAPAQNWTQGGIKSLSLWVHGAAGNTGRLYVAINGTKVLYDGDAADMARSQWQPWNIDLSTVGANLSSVATLSIGIQGAGSGVIYVDDIRLYAQDLVKITPTDPDPTGLSAHYTMDEGAGTTVGDSSGNSNHGVIVGDPVWTAGVLGGALELSGNDYVDCGDDDSLKIRDAITVACWIKVASFTVDWETIVAMGDDSYRMTRTSGTGDAIHFGCNGLSGGNVDGMVIVTTDTWRHVALVYDGSHASIYIDGFLDISVASTGQIDVSAYNLYIGENSQATGRQLAGLVDDVRIYNRALSPGEVASLAGLTEPIYKPF